MEKPKAFVVRMSNKMDIQIDDDEVYKVIQGIAKGQPVRVRQGVINPSFYIAIVEDVDRLKSYFEEINRIRHENEQNEKYNFNGGMQKELPQFTQLKDIFEGVKLLGGPDQKKLN